MRTTKSSTNMNPTLITVRTLNRQPDGAGPRFADVRLSRWILDACALTVEPDEAFTCPGCVSLKPWLKLNSG